MQNNNKHQHPAVTIANDDGHQYHLILGQRFESDTPPFLILPAMGVPARKYIPLLDSLNQNCLNVAVMEWRGIETSNIRPSRRVDFGFKEMLADIQQSVEKTCQLYQAERVYLLGHSLGGQLSYLYCARHPEQVAGIIGVASGSPYFRNWHGFNRYGLYLFSGFMRLVASLVGYFPGSRLGFAGNEARGMLRDWRRAVTSGRYSPVGTDYDFEQALTQVHTRALMMTIADDWLAPPESSKNLAAKLSHSEVTHHHFGADEIGHGVTGHFQWMKQPRPVVDRIIAWLESQFSGEG